MDAQLAADRFPDRPATPRRRRRSADSSAAGLRLGRGPADLPALLDVLCLRVGSRPARLGRSRLVCVDGPAGAGKTTLAGQLAQWLDAPIVHMEDLYGGWDGLEDSWGRLSEWILQPWSSGRDGAIRPYDWNEGTYGEWQPIRVHPFLIVEGCGSGRREAEEFASMIVWLDVEASAGQARAVARDGEHTRAALRRWQSAQAAHFTINQTADRADLRLRMT